VKVKVDIGAKRLYTYDAPDGTQVGDAVTVPPSWGHDPMPGRVAEIGSDYDGEIRAVLTVTASATVPES
jgi:primosomal protein N'